MPPPTLRIAVLSDQHIDTVASPSSWELARAAFAAAVRAKADHVVLAGDTFDCATAMRRDREVVARELRRLGLWRRDRLTILPGNHDMFHTPHHGTRAEKAVELARNALSFDARGPVRGPENERAFDEWTRPLSSAADRVHARRTFPLRKVVGHVALYAADTAPKRTLSCANGFWQTEVDELLRAATPEAEERRVLAIHHPPQQSRQTRITDVVKYKFPLAFPPKNFKRLSSFLTDASIDAVVCGHIHKTSRYRWSEGSTRVFLQGRTGGMHGTKAIVGLLDVPLSGSVRWSEVAL